MGNTLVSMAPTAIHPIEYYLADISEFEFIKSLGSTRFLKVAKCRHYEGDCVVKILPFEDPSLPLAAHKTKIEQLSAETIKNVSIAAFHRVSILPNFAFMARQYVKYSLYDRLSTRPFLSYLEKCWIAFQLFKCFDWCHSRGITHGDLKLENILITSSLWVVISDFATYKPVYLPDDNPTDFSYFFDTSRRRCCSIAPERFISDYSSQTSTELFHQSSASEPVVTPQMDIFSLGCVMAELFSDDAPNGNLFDLGNLLRYRAHQYHPDKQINSISSEEIKKLIMNLINLDPLKRNSASQVIQDLTPDVFPEYFELLYDYLRQLVKLPPDAKIIRLSQETQRFLPPVLDQEPNDLLLILVVITSTMRSLKHCHCKILAQRLACKIVCSSPAMSVYITDRLLPYLLQCLEEKDPRVRAEAIESIANSLEHVTQLTQSDNNIFTDYILPVLCTVSNDPSVLVRICLALNVSRLAKIALNFLSQSCDQNYDEELVLLHDSFQIIVSRLLIDSSNCVRRSLLSTPESCADLCVFFNKQKTNDVILSHIITFLNDKSDFQLRLTFFENIVIIASFLGIQCSQIIHPLLQQGLCDPEETIISKTIDSISSLVNQGLLPKSIIYELTFESMPFLSHPNLWIRHSMIDLVLILSSKLSLADVNCKIKPAIDFYLKQKINSLNNSSLLIDSIHDPIPREIYDLVVISKLGCDLFFDYLTKRSEVRSFSKHQLNSLTEDPLYTRLTHEGITDLIEEQLLKLADIIKKINMNKKSQHFKKVSGNIMTTKKTERFGFSVSLYDESQDKPNHKRQISATMNDEWLHMFGSTTNNKTANSDDDDSSREIPVAHEAREVGEEMSIHVQCPPCQSELNKLINHKKIHYVPPLNIKVIQSSPFRPKGVLIAHLQEHDSAVNRVIHLEDTSFFATCSSDGTVKIWDSSKMEGKSTANRSKQTYVAQSLLYPQSIGGITFCKDCIVCYTNTNFIHVLEVDNATAKMKLINTFEVKSEISATNITDIATISNNVFAISCSDSTIHGYDLRQMNTINTTVKPIWKLTTQAHERLINTITGQDVVLFAGTSRGLLVTFDLRFLMRSNTMGYPNQIRLRRLLWTQSGLYSAAQGNSEVSLWNCETGSRIRTLWASTAPALSLTQSSSHSVLGMLLINNGKDSSSMITCGTDMKIRYWDLVQPERSYIISENNLKSNNNNNNVKYSSKFIEGIQVIQEYKQESQYQTNKDQQHLPWDQQTVSSSHRDCISDVTRVNNLLISTSKDGVVKVWK